MTRLAIVRQKYNPSGGAERIVSAVLAQLGQQAELEPVLITRNWEALDGVKVHRVNPFYLGSVWRDWGFARAARETWQRLGADLVQYHERTPGCHIFRAGDGVHAAWLAARTQGQGWRARLAIALNPYHRFKCAIEREMFQHPALQAVICCSHMVRNDVLRYFPLAPERCVVIHNGVNSDFFNPQEASATRQALRRQYGISDESPLLVYVGSGFERKGVAQAINAIVPHRAVHLMVVGADKQLARYRQLAATLGVETRVHFSGAQRDVRAYYGMADGFILPSIYEPFGSVVAEAMACALPILTSTRCGAAELVQEGSTGWLAAPQDTEAWQRNVGAWLAARARWPEIGAAARLRVQDLTEEHMVAQMLALYARILEQRAHGQAIEGPLP